MVVEVALDLLGLHLGRKGEGVHQELTEGGRRLGFLVENVGDVIGHALQHLKDLLDRTLQSLDVGVQHLAAVLAVARTSDEFQAALLGVAVLDLVRDGDEEAAVGGALRSHADRGADVGVCGDVLAGDGRDGEVDCGVRPGALALLRVEVLDQGGEGVELVASGVPANEDLLGRGLLVQLQHALLVVHVDLDLLGGLGVGHGVAVLDLDLGAILRPRAQKGSDNALLVCGSPAGVVEDAEKRLGLDGDGAGRSGRG